MTEGVETVESLCSNSCESDSTLSTNSGGRGGVEGEDDPIRVAGNVELVKSAIALNSPEAIQELSARWSREFKAMVLSFLSDEERDFCRRNLVFDGI
ncbi:MAG: hypothetical protein DSM106950_38600 [Stigonema ocellatum SAG 48.90 = DSM 106950]|nr:hypothetical protein [Stigonema ocellatum SAG 48.90 = DSM 106950]